MSVADLAALQTILASSATTRAAEAILPEVQAATNITSLSSVNLLRSRIDRRSRTLQTKDAVEEGFRHSINRKANARRTVPSLLDNSMTSSKPASTTDPVLARLNHQRTHAARQQQAAELAATPTRFQTRWAIPYIDSRVVVFRAQVWIHATTFAKDWISQSAQERSVHRAIFSRIRPVVPMPVSRRAAGIYSQTFAWNPFIAAGEFFAGPAVHTGVTRAVPTLTSAAEALRAMPCAPAMQPAEQTSKPLTDVKAAAKPARSSAARRGRRTQATEEVVDLASEDDVDMTGDGTLSDSDSSNAAAAAAAAGAAASTGAGEAYETTPPSAMMLPSGGLTPMLDWLRAADVRARVEPWFQCVDSTSRLSTAALLRVLAGGCSDATPTSNPFYALSHHASLAVSWKTALIAAHSPMNLHVVVSAAPHIMRAVHLPVMASTRCTPADSIQSRLQEALLVSAIQRIQERTTDNNLGAIMKRFLNAKRPRAVAVSFMQAVESWVKMVFQNNRYSTAKEREQDRDHEIALKVNSATWNNVTGAIKEYRVACLTAQDTEMLFDAGIDTSTQTNGSILRVAEAATEREDRDGDDDPRVQSPGLFCKLHPYQRRTVAWMIAQEEEPLGLAQGLWLPIVLGPTPAPDPFAVFIDCSHAPLMARSPAASPTIWVTPFGHVSMERPSLCRGGLLASEMGLGKTIMVAALILAKPRHPLNSDASPPPEIRAFTDTMSRSTDPQLTANATPVEIIAARPQFQDCSQTDFIKESVLRASDWDERLSIQRAVRLKHASLEGARAPLGRWNWPEWTWPTFSSQHNESTRMMGVGESAGLRLRSRATLVVCPVTLIGQWDRELDIHAPALRVVLFHSQHRQRMSLDDLLRADVVLTTYTVLCRDNSEVFSLIEWHRIVLDESQQVKNRSTRTTSAAFGLRARNRWLSTGTPLSKTGADDILGQLITLRAQPFCDPQIFSTYVKKPLETRVGGGLDMMFRHFWANNVRRHSKAYLESRNELRLPARESRIVHVDVPQSSQFRTIYNALLANVRRKYKVLKAAGRLRNSVTLLTSLIQQLRTCASHPGLVSIDALAARTLDTDAYDVAYEAHLDDDAGAATESGTTEEASGATIRTAAHASDIGKDGLLKLVDAVIKHLQKQQRLLEARSKQLGRESQAVIDGKAVHRLKADTEADRMLEAAIGECPVCLELVEIPVFTPCLHVFCRECVRGVRNRAFNTSCPICRGELSKSDVTITSAELASALANPTDLNALIVRRVDLPLPRSVVNALRKERDPEGLLGALEAAAEEGDDDVGDDADDDEDDDQDMSAGASKPAQGRRRRRQMVRVTTRKGEVMSVSKTVFEAYMAMRTVNGPKIDTLLTELRKIQAAEPSNKTIIFTSFSGMIERVGSALRAASIGYKALDGSMSAQQRQASITAFATNSDCNVLVLAMRAAGVGLNLTMANHIIFLEPGLNVELEAQAVGRVHRMGQQRTVNIIRILTRTTIDHSVAVVAARTVQANLHDPTKAREAMSGAAERETDTEKRARLDDLIQLLEGDIEASDETILKADREAALASAATRSSSAGAALIGSSSAAAAASSSSAAASGFQTPSSPDSPTDESARRDDGDRPTIKPRPAEGSDGYSYTSGRAAEQASFKTSGSSSSSGRGRRPRGSWVRVRTARVWDDYFDQEEFGEGYDSDGSEYYGRRHRRDCAVM